MHCRVVSPVEKYRITCLVLVARLQPAIDGLAVARLQLRINRHSLAGVEWVVRARQVRPT